MIESGAARTDEYPRIRDIVARAFSTEDEADLWDYLVAHDPDLTPECVRVARLEGRIVARTVVLPRSIRSRIGLVRGAIVTLVACDPAHWGEGYGSASVRNALEYLTATGCAIGILYGHPTYYPRFGFVPVLASASTDLASSTYVSAAAPFLPRIDERDLPLLTELYTHGLGGYPCAVARTADAWIWRPRRTAEVVTSSSVTGYAEILPESRQQLRRDFPIHFPRWSQEPFWY